MSTASGSVTARTLSLPPGLTPAEREVARVLAEGLSNQEIADRLGKSVHAVKFLLHSIYARTGLGNRTQLIVAMYAGYRGPASAV
ncbi:MAG TPA: helix-turn-helix transcriptional regulator [Vicinamibacterales bacterium]